MRARCLGSMALVVVLGMASPSWAKGQLLQTARAKLGQLGSKIGSIALRVPGVERAKASVDFQRFYWKNRNASVGEGQTVKSLYKQAKRENSVGLNRVLGGWNLGWAAVNAKNLVVLAAAKAGAVTLAPALGLGVATAATVWCAKDAQKGLDLSRGQVLARAKSAGLNAPEGAMKHYQQAVAGIVRKEAAKLAVAEGKLQAARLLGKSTRRRQNKVVTAAARTMKAQQVLDQLSQSLGTP